MFSDLTTKEFFLENYIHPTTTILSSDCNHQLPSSLFPFSVYNYSSFDLLKQAPILGLYGLLYFVFQFSSYNNNYDYATNGPLAVHNFKLHNRTSSHIGVHNLNQFCWYFVIRQVEIFWRAILLH